MIRFLLRTIGFLCVVAGFIALVVDATLFIANEVWAPTRLQMVLNSITPDGAGRLADLASQAPAAWLWSPTLSFLLAAPAWAAGFSLGLLLMLIGRRRERPQHFET